MGMLFFLPWISFEKEYDFSQFRILPYNSRCENGFEIKKYSTDIKKILSYYKTVEGTSVQFTSILIHAEKTLLSNLSEDEISDMFVYGEMLKLAGLSKREYFSPTKKYSNSDTYRLVMQKFPNSNAIPVIESRRRDGSMSDGFDPEIFQVVCPFHVSPFVAKTLDASLVKAMLKCYSDNNEIWHRVYDATLAFNASNSDNPGTSPSLEVVLTIGAFERVLGLRGGNGKELSRAFSDILKEVPIATELEELKRFRIAPQDNATIRETWIRDCLIVRNDLAHGKRHSTYKTSWTLHEHLLLASYIFPLVVKLVLNKEGAYTMSDTDRLAIYSFDYLLHTNNIFEPRMHNGTNSFPWRNKLNVANFNWSRKM